MQKNEQESGHMRLTCPRCGAEYEIAESLIPQQGREVECWACNHVWRQPGLAQSAEFNPEMRPQLNRPLNESILSVLREEAARELEARKAEQQGGATPTDHNSATGAPSPAAETDPVADPAPSADPLPLEAAAVASDPPSPLGDIGTEWPAATITAPPAAEATPVPSPASRDDIETEIAAGQGVHDHPSARHGSIAHFDADDFEFPPPPPRRLRDQAAREQDEAQNDPSPATLPDAEALAATLTGPETTGQHPSSTLTSGINVPAAALPTSVVPADPDAPTQVPLLAASSGFASGFGLAVMLGCAALALYALAPRLSPEDGLLMTWRQEVDRGRVWLDESVTSIFAPEDAAPGQPAE